MQSTWLFRKKRDLGNFSIEQSFGEVANAWPDENKPEWLEATHYSEGWLNRWKIIRFTRSVKTDILHITGDIHFAALAWPKLLGSFIRRPVVVLTIHDIGFIRKHQGWKRWIMKLVWISWPLRCIDRLITVSEATKKAVLQEAPWFPESKITVIPTVVPQHFQKRETVPKNLKPIALHIGLAGNKNLRRHAEALQELDVQLRIIGEPSPEDCVMLNELGIDYSTQSNLSNAEMQKAYATSDFLLFASTLEGFGMPIIEAQMVGLPVITSNMQPMKDVAGDGALFCNPWDVNSIHNSIEKALKGATTNAQSHGQLTERGFKNSARFTPKESAKLLHQFYINIPQ